MLSVLRMEFKRPFRSRMVWILCAASLVVALLLCVMVVVAVTNGRLDFGTWEQIFYFEFDGKRDKHALIKIIGE